MMPYNLVLQRVVVARLVFSCFLVALLFRFFINATPSTMLQPVLFRLNFDFTYWLVHLARINFIVMQTTAGAVVFDFLLFSTCLLCIAFPLKNGYAIFFGFLFLIYAVLYNSYIVHHPHQLAVMTLITVPFFFKNLRKWSFAWEAMRYYICYVYVASFVWKAFIGKSLFYWNMGAGSAKVNLVEYMYSNPNTIFTTLYQFLVSHPTLLNIGFLFIFLLEGVMVIGFFTKRYDSYLILIPFIIHFATYLFADVFFFEMLVGVVTFLSLKQVTTIREKFYLLNTNYKSKGRTLSPP